MDGDDEYPDLYLEENDVYTASNSTKKLYVPPATHDTGVGRSLNLSSSPTIVHFGGFKVGNSHEQTISIVNCSPNSQRFSFLPMTTEYFKVFFFYIFPLCFCNNFIPDGV